MIKQYGTAKRLAEILDTDANYISQLKNGTSGKKMGNAFARKIELKLDMEIGELDSDVNLTTSKLNHNLEIIIKEVISELSSIDALVVNKPFNFDSIAKLITARLNNEIIIKVL